MNSYIIELLKDNNTVIIPGLGAISVTDRAKGEYMFMSYLKHNDGLLKNHIAALEGISTDQAQEIIDLFVSQSNEKLRSGSRVELAGLGAFFINKSGDIDFDSTSQGNLESADAGEAPTVVEEKKEEIIDPVEEVKEQYVAEAVVEESEVSEPESIENKIEEIVTEKEEIVEETIVPIVETAAVVVHPVSEEINDADSQVYSEQQQWEDDLDIPPIDAKIERPKKPIVEKAKFDKKKKRGKGKVILIAVAAILVLGSVPTFMYFDDIKAKLFGAKSEGIGELADAKQFEFETEQEEDANHYVDQVKDEVADSTVEELAVEELAPAPAPETPSSNSMESNMGDNGSFHLIVGSFQNQAYAQNFEKKMRAEGNTNANVLGPIGGFYLVSLGAYPSQQEAKSAIAEKIGNYPKLWIYAGGK